MTAEGPEMALAVARRTPAVDVVVTDVVMKGDERAGLRLLPALRAAGIHAPVVVITAFADVEKVKIALNEGAAHLLEKPFRAPELIAAIERACQPRGDAAHRVDDFLSRPATTRVEGRVVDRRSPPG